MPRPMPRCAPCLCQSAALPPPLFKEDPVLEPTFPKLRVKHKALVPEAEGGVEGGVDLAQRGVDVEPEAWAAMLADTARPKVTWHAARESVERSGRYSGD